VVNRAEHRQQMVDTVRTVLGMRGESEMQLNLPGIDRAALIG